MYTISIDKRLTHKWADGYSAMDNWVSVGHLRLTPAKQVTEGNSYDEGGTYVQYARVPAGQSIKDTIDGVRSTLGGSSCRHEYDCCGCLSRSVHVKHLGSRRLLIHTRVSFNY